MKVRLTALFLLLVSMPLTLLLSGCSNDSSSLVGKWIDVKTEAIYEYTENYDNPEDYIDFIHNWANFY